MGYEGSRAHRLIEWATEAGAGQAPRTDFPHHTEELAHQGAATSPGPGVRQGCRHLVFSLQNPAPFATICANKTTTSSLRLSPRKSVEAVSCRICGWLINHTSEPQQVTYFCVGKGIPTIWGYDYHQNVDRRFKSFGGSLRLWVGSRPRTHAPSYVPLSLSIRDGIVTSST